MSKPKLMVLGHSKHGKDEVCKILRDTHGYTFTSSSMAALSTAIWPAMREYYDSQGECFADRHNWRPLWNQLIRRYTFEDPAQLARHIFDQSDIYCGIRSDVEFETARRAGLFDLSVWVDASQRVPPESTDSCQVTQDMAGVILDNNGDLKQLRKNVADLVEAIECK